MEETYHSNNTMRARERFRHHFDAEWSDPAYLVEIKQLVARIANVEVSREELLRRGLLGIPDAPAGLMGWGPQHQQFFLVDVVATQTHSTRLARALLEELRVQYGCTDVNTWALQHRCEEWEAVLAAEALERDETTQAPKKPRKKRSK